MSRQDKIRLVVTVRSGANAELWDEIADLPASQRSERLRYLASLGAQLAKTGVIVSPVAGQALPAAMAETGHDEVGIVDDEDREGLKRWG